jgi:hypothetical protein
MQGAYQHGYLSAPMENAQENEQRKPKLKDERRCDRFIEAAREHGADESSNAFDGIADEMGRKQDVGR